MEIPQFPGTQIAVDLTAVDLMLDGFLVGGFNPSEKYARQTGNLSQIEVNIENIENSAAKHLYN